MSLEGAQQFQARLRAMRQSFKPMGKDWATATASNANRTAPRGATGRLSSSHKVKSATQRKATVVGMWYGPIVNRGAKAHAITARRARNLVFTSQGQTIFARKVRHRGFRGTRYADKAAQAAARKHVSVRVLIDAWNEAA